MKALYKYLQQEIIPQYTQIFTVIKPGFLDHASDIISMFEHEGWNLFATRTKQLTLEEAKALYKVHKDEDWYDNLCEYMSSGPSMAIAYRLGYKADYKKIFADVGELKDQIRKKWGIDDCKNVMHSSDSFSAM